LLVKAVKIAPNVMQQRVYPAKVPYARKQAITRLILRGSKT